MHARRIDQDDGRYSVKLCWNLCEVKVLTGRQRAVFNRLVELQVAEAGRDSLLRSGLLQALFALATYPWWDGRLSSLVQEFEPEPAPDPEPGPAA